MSGVLSFTKKRVFTPGLFSFCHVGNLSCGKKDHLERMLRFHRASIILYPSSSSLVRMANSVQMTDFGKPSEEINPQAEHTGILDVSVHFVI